MAKMSQQQPPQPTSPIIDNAVPSFPMIIHPGHACLVLSFPFCVQAYRGYHRSLVSVVPQALRKEAAPEGIRRAFGFLVASRALSVATYGSFGVFGWACAVAFYATGCSSIPEAMEATRRWAHGGRRQMDSWLGVNDRLDCDHPEVKEIAQLDESEQMEILFPAKDYMDLEEDHSNDTTS